MWLEKKYILLCGSSLRNFKQKSDTLFNCACPFCGDSNTNRRKARGYFYCRNGNFFYRCHNCNYGTTFRHFLKETNQSLYHDFIVENFNNDKPEILSDDHRTEEHRQGQLNEYCKNLSELPQDHPANRYACSRGLPAGRLRELYFSHDLNELKPLFGRYADTHFDAEPRLLIPHYTPQHKLVGIAARAIGPSKLRYVNMKMEDDTSLIFNIQNIDFSKLVYVTEGAFDSMFLPNAMAATGTDFGRVEPHIVKDNTVIIVDNQPRNREVVRHIYTLAKNGYRLFIWPSHVKEKDINEFVLNRRIDEPDLVQFIAVNTFQGMQLQLKIAAWKLCTLGNKSNHDPILQV